MTQQTSIAVEVRYFLPAHLRGANKKDLHRIVMSGFPQGVLNPKSPRADARCLFTITHEALLVRHRPELTHQLPGLIGEYREVRQTSNAQSYNLAVTVNAEVSRSQRGALPAEVRAEHSPRGHRVPVPPEELNPWATGLLTRSGLEPEEITVGPRFNVKRAAGRGGILPAVTVTAHVSGGVPLDTALINGIGRCRNYGLGMIQFEPII